MKNKFLNLVNKIDMKFLEAQRVPNKLDPERTIPRHIIIKMPKVKDKEKTLKAAREKQRVTYKGVPISEISQAVRDKYHMILPLTRT